MVKYTKILLPVVAIALLSCEHNDVYKPVDFNITLDPANTYIAGDPVVFDIKGEVDNLYFYSGTIGSQFKYRDRYEVAMDEVENATLNTHIQAKYGSPGALEIYVSNSFEGLKGNDGAADRQTIKDMVAGGMQGWKRLDYAEGASGKWTDQGFDVSDCLSNFSLAFHWCPETNTATQRTYWIDSSLEIALAGTTPSTIEFGSDAMPFVSVMMNEEKDPYYKNKGNGSIIDNDFKTATIKFQGVGANALPYALDVWAISKPMPLNKVANDKGTVIKNLENYMDRYEYVYTEPGTYTVTFIGTNCNYMGSSEDTQSFSFTIVERPINE